MALKECVALDAYAGIFVDLRKCVLHIWFSCYIIDDFFLGGLGGVSQIVIIYYVLHMLVG